MVTVVGGNDRVEADNAHLPKIQSCADMKDFQKDELRVSWFVERDVLRQAMSGGRKIKQSDLRIDDFRRCLVYCQIGQIQQYCNRTRPLAP